jgi:sulfatase maturation enzyme AslB (radical SAM superfamily)
VKETQDKNRLFKNNSSSFEVIVKNINYLKEHFSTKFILNKVITSGNYKNFQEDLFFLMNLEPFSVHLNVALGDGGWNEEKFKDFFEIVQSFFEKIKLEPGIEKKFKNMFEDFSNECVFSYIVCSPLGDIYPCEILFSLDKGSIGPIENINKDILKCSYSPENKKCSGQLCRDCGDICKKVSFNSGKLSEESSEESFLWLKNAHTFQASFKKLKSGNNLFEGIFESS